MNNINTSMPLKAKKKKKNLAINGIGAFQVGFSIIIMLG
jgi:hypothetical protein